MSNENEASSPPKELIIDSTKLKCFLDCPRKYYYNFVKHWMPESPSIHLEFGIAWHEAKEHLLLNPGDILGAYQKFLARYRETYPEVMDTSNSPKNPAGAIMALEIYPKWAKSHNTDWKIECTEVAGTVAINADTELAFKIDAVVNTPNGLYALDHKTCSRLSQAWCDSWQVSFQIWIYIHALSSYYGRERVAGALIDGTCFRKNDCEHIRVTVARTDQQMQSMFYDIQTWCDLLKWNHKQLLECKPDDPTLYAFPRNTESCSKYGQCPYFALCMAWANPLPRKNPGGFVEREWNPLVEHETANLKIKV